MSEVIAIVLFSYFGTGLLLAFHIALTHWEMRKTKLDAPLREFADAVDWFIFIELQRGGVWGLMARLLVDPWHFTRIAKDINQ